jgi:hypothetical protein
MGIPTGTRDRDHVAKIAATEPQEALRIARHIEDPWFKCQALALVAYRCNDFSKKNTIINESFQTALQLNDLNRIVSISAWPLKVLNKSGQAEKVKKEANRLLDIISKEQSPVRRADALNLVLGALLNGPLEIFWQVFEAFKSACDTRLIDGKRNTKGESTLCIWIPVVNRLDGQRTKEILQQIKAPTLRERAVESIQEHENTELHRLIYWPNLD